MLWEVETILRVCIAKLYIVLFSYLRIMMIKQETTVKEKNMSKTLMIFILNLFLIFIVILLERNKFTLTWFSCIFSNKRLMKIFVTFLDSLVLK